MYTAVVLTPDSFDRLKERFHIIVPANWSYKGHHMTINMGSAKSGPAHNYLGQLVEVNIVSFASDENKVMALGVECVVPSSNAQPHITLAVNVANGGKPVMSNQLTNWVKLPIPMTVMGTVQEIN
jgi:hypothetical protein